MQENNNLVSNCCGSSYSFDYVSNCCNALFLGNTDVCIECREHAEAIEGYICNNCNETTEEETQQEYKCNQDFERYDNSRH